MRHDWGMSTRLLFICLVAFGALPGFASAGDTSLAPPVQADRTDAALDPTTPDVPEEALRTASADTPSTWSWGLGALQYREPGLMQLSGPQAGLQWRYRPWQAGWSTGWPEQMNMDAEIGGLRYSSHETGSLHGVVSLGGRASGLWRLHDSGDRAWHAGLQIDLLWTDLRGTSSTGHRGYRRLGSKLWAVLQFSPDALGSQWQWGALLRGRQDSLLSDMGERDITNTQRQGFFVAYQHRPLPGAWGAMRPWLRYADVRRSDLDGRYYEPHNRQLQIGLLFDF